MEGSRHRRHDRSQLGPLVAGATPEPTSLLGAHRGKVGLALVVLVVVGLVATLRSRTLDEWIWLVSGESYVRWRSPRWKAINTSEKLEWALVVYRAPPDVGRAPLDPLLADRSVQDVADSVVWHDASDAPADVAAAELTFYDPGGAEVLAGPIPVDELTAPELAELIVEVGEEAAALALER